MHPALRKGPRFTKNTPYFPLFTKTPPFSTLKKTPPFSTFLQKAPPPRCLRACECTRRSSRQSGRIVCRGPVPAVATTRVCNGRVSVRPSRRSTAAAVPSGLPLSALWAVDIDRQLPTLAPRTSCVRPRQQRRRGTALSCKLNRYV